MFEIHEAANIFPIDEDHLQELADDIKQHGQRVEIETLDGKVIDGRRRLKACEMAGVNPKCRSVFVKDPVEYVVSLNLHRRHLTASQRGMIAARAKDVYEKAAKERQQASGGDRKSSNAKSVVATVPQPIDAGKKSRDQAGAALGVSGRIVSDAARVIEHGTPEHHQHQEKEKSRKRVDAIGLTRQRRRCCCSGWLARCQRGRMPARCSSFHESKERKESTHGSETQPYPHPSLRGVNRARRRQDRRDGHRV